MATSILSTASTFESPSLLEIITDFTGRFPSLSAGEVGYALQVLPRDARGFLIAEDTAERQRLEALSDDEFEAELQAMMEAAIPANTEN